MLSSFKVQLISDFLAAISFVSSEESALLDMKTFLDGEAINNYYDNEKSYGERLSDRAYRKDTFTKEVVRGMFNMTENDFSDYFRPDNLTIEKFKIDPEFLSDKLRSIAQSYRGFANAGFADQVISFVNTGVSNF